MNRINVTTGLLRLPSFWFILVVLVSCLPGTSLAHGRVHLGFHFGSLWWPSLYPPYHETVVVERQVPLVYIEKDKPQASSNNAASTTVGINYWYYCAKVEKYYPYVRTCPSGWDRVSAKPQDLPETQ